MTRATFRAASTPKTSSTCASMRFLTPMSIEPRFCAIAESAMPIAALPATAPRSSARRRRLTPGRLAPGGILFGPLVILTVWELASRLGLLSPRLLAAPSKAVVTGYALIVNGTLTDSFLASAQRAYLGLAIGVVAGVVLAL